MEKDVEIDISLDKNFDLRYENNHFKIDNKSVHFQEEGIAIDGKVYSFHQKSRTN